MTGSLVLPDHPSTELAEYKSATGLIRRGLDDVTHTLRLRPNTLYVPTDCGSLQLAIDCASEGDIIEILPGVYELNIVVQKALTIRAHSGFVQLKSQDEDEPLLLIDLEFGELNIERIAFTGRAGSFLAAEPPCTQRMDKFY